MRQGEKPGKSKAETRRSVAGKPPKREASARREFEKRLAEALEQQTATSEILRVISSSPTDIQSLFDTIVQSAVRLCDGLYGAVNMFDGEMLLRPVAFHNYTARALAAVERMYPMRPDRQQLTGRAILSRTVAHIPDIVNDPEYAPDIASAGGWRSAVAAPMLREGHPIGTILVTRAQAGPFSERQIALLETFAAQAVIGIENVRLFNETKEALEQQTASSEILRVISSSPTDLQPVFDTIAGHAMRLCNALHGLVLRFDGELIHLAALANASPGDEEALRRAFPRSPSRTTAGSRAVLTGATVHIPDIQSDPEYAHEVVRTAHYASIVSVPMLRDGQVIGTLNVHGGQIGQFSTRQIRLLETFADQAVIAIENVRLFTELQTRNGEITEALEQQTATSEILQVISSSPTDLQPVFDIIAESAVKLCGAEVGLVTRFDGEWVDLKAVYGSSFAGTAALRRAFPMRPTGAGAAARAIRDRAIAHIPDVRADREYGIQEAAVAGGFRAVLAVPMLREGRAIGSVGIARSEAGEFSERQIKLLRTFADQAVIAIENVRLFTELEGRNRDLMATSEILRVISSSPTDVQPVFDTIVRSAVRLCDGLFSGLLQFDGELIQHVAEHNFTPEALEEVRRIFPARPTRALYSGRAILERAVVHIPDVDVDDPEYQHHAVTHAIGWRSGLWVPMLREGAPIGVIMVARAVAGPFSDNEVELLKTFADQAVIAVENVRLFKELQARTGELTQSVEKLTALGEVSRAVSSTLDVETVLNTIVSRASQLASADGCSIFEYDEATEQFELRASHNDDTEFVEALRAVPLRKGEGLMGRAAEMREPVQVADITQPGAYQSSVRDTLIQFGYRAVLSVPLLREDQIIGSLSFNRKATGEFPPEVVDVLKTFATQSALAIQNARLFREIEDKSRQLEAASQHKSEFLANMSHELRTPLNAIIGFSEILAEKMFGDINEKQTEYLQDILESGRHLLSLINDILDLSKIEAGRMELDVGEFDLPSAIGNALILVRERASRRGIRLGSTIDGRLGMIGGDERKVKQVLLNLLSNALKFTPEGGRIDVDARLDGEMAEISVTDTGIGIAPEDQGAVFEEFQQVGTADKKAEGTGLGLALSRKFIELHGGRIWLKSQLGAGSTFTFTLPLGR